MMCLWLIEPVALVVGLSQRQQKDRGLYLRWLSRGGSDSASPGQWKAGCLPQEGPLSSFPKDFNTALLFSFFAANATVSHGCKGSRPLWLTHFHPRGCLEPRTSGNLHVVHERIYRKEKKSHRCMWSIAGKQADSFLDYLSWVERIYMGVNAYIVYIQN